MAPPSPAKGVWTSSEHERFLEAVSLYPHGPWTLITEHIGTRSAKQVQTHAQKYQLKLQRHERGLIKRKTKSSRVEHRVDKSTADYLTKGFIARPAHRTRHSLHCRPSPSDSPSPFYGSETSESEADINICGPSFSPYDLPLLRNRASSCPTPRRSTTPDSFVGFSCPSPRGLEQLFRDIEPLPFESSRGLDDICLQESVQFLEICGFLGEQDR